uniref:Oxysterol-binding protein n=1 Tax=Malurus cyaneus samueli TaxID=2593467 RepID=A0A8C5X5E6_9PASS
MLWVLLPQPWVFSPLLCPLPRPQPLFPPCRRSGSNLSGASEGHPEDWNLEDSVSWLGGVGGVSSYNESTGKDLLPRKRRRSRIPDKPNYSLNLWSIMKNCIGKELSKIPMPVNFNEPLSMLQRLTEDLEYHELLDKAVKCESSTEQMCFVAAFSVSSYSTTVHRTAKPFNPLLGETFELDRLDELGFRSLCEQVSHHPPAAAHHVYSRRGWTLWQEITIASKFRGKYLSIMPLGAIHLEFHSSGNHYVWRKVTSTVHNIIVGKLWIDQSGEIEIVNHKSKDKCQLKFSPYSYFSRDVPRKVSAQQGPCSLGLRSEIWLSQTPSATGMGPSTVRKVTLSLWRPLGTGDSSRAGLQSLSELWELAAVPALGIFPWDGDSSTALGSLSQCLTTRILGNNITQFTSNLKSCVTRHLCCGSPGRAGWHLCVPFSGSCAQH